MRTTDWTLPRKRALEATDPEIAGLIARETRRQNDGIELIASENFVSPAVLEALGSPLTNKYAEGLPGQRYYGGCEVVDQVEALAMVRARMLFGAYGVNVQPHSGAQANMAAFIAAGMKPGDTFLGMDLTAGGHLTHGSPVNFSGILYNAVSYGVDDNGLIDYNQVRSLAQEHKPKMVLAGYSAYSRVINFATFAEIAREVGAVFMVDMAHFAGLVAADLYPSPVPHADIVTATTHKTLRGPRGGLILCTPEYEKKVNKAVFPYSQGGPLEHVIAAKAVCFLEALAPSFREYQIQVKVNASVLAERLIELGFHVVSGGTDNHLMLLDLRELRLDGKSVGEEMTGKRAEELLEKVGITVNKNTVPKETRSPFVTSGVRIGTPAVTTRGLGQDEMKEIALILKMVISAGLEANWSVMDEVKKMVHEMTMKFPLYGEE